MKSIALLAAFAGLFATSLADYSPTSVWWRAWRVSTSEYLTAGSFDAKYTVLNAFDSDPGTTWVLNRSADKTQLPSYFRKDGFSLDSVDGAKMVDGFRIMNGYNKSQRLYDRNDAVSEISLYIGDKLLKKVRLADRLGWHTVSLPPTPLGDNPDGYYSDLTFRVTGVRKGKVHDLCISGLELLHKGKSLPWRMDKLVFFNPGGETEPGDTELWTSKGKPVVTDRGNNLEGPIISPNGRYVIGTDCPNKSISLWVADLNEGRVIYRKRMFSEPNPDYPHVYHDSAKWIGRRLADVEFEVHVSKTSNESRHVTKRIRF